MNFSIMGFRVSHSQPRIPSPLSYAPHTIVIPDIVFEVKVIHDNIGYETRGALIQPIGWRRVTDKAEVEVIMLQWNKRHLQQMASESSPLRMNYFQKVTENFGASPLADKLLDGEITDKLDAFPPTVRAWLLQFKQIDKER